MLLEESGMVYFAISAHGVWVWDWQGEACKGGDKSTFKNGHTNPVLSVEFQDVNK